MPDSNPSTVISPIHADLDPGEHVYPEHAGEEQARHGQTQPNLQPHGACNRKAREIQKWAGK